MLAQVLRRLEHDGLVNRTVYPVVPPRTEYSLTKYGQKLHEPIAMLCQWARSNEAVINAIYAEKGKSTKE
jgi:DNA-binding HxlR family transcriptional regulator